MEREISMEKCKRLTGTLCLDHRAEPYDGADRLAGQQNNWQDASSPAMVVSLVPFWGPLPAAQPTFCRVRLRERLPTEAATAAKELVTLEPTQCDCDCACDC